MKLHKLNLNPIGFLLVWKNICVGGSNCRDSKHRGYAYVCACVYQPCWSYIVVNLLNTIIRAMSDGIGDREQNAEISCLLSFFFTIVQYSAGFCFYCSGPTVNCKFTLLWFIILVWQWIVEIVTNTSSSYHCHSGGNKHLPIWWKFAV